MARVRVSREGKTGTIDKKELQMFLDEGWSVVDQPQSGEAEEESPEDQAANASRERAETFNDGFTGFERGVTFGMDDVAAGAGAFAGDAYQSWADGRPRDPNAYQSGVDGRRQQVQAARERSPTATGVGEVAGTLATIAAPGLRVAKAPTKLGKVARGAATGAVGGAFAGVGFGDADDVKGAALDAAGGAVGGAVIGGTLGTAALLPAVARGGWRGLLKQAGKLDDAVSGSPKLDAAVDFIPGVGGTRKALKLLKPTEEATQSLAPEVEVSKDALQSYLDRLMPKVADDAPKAPAWLQAADDIVPPAAPSGRALPLVETPAEIARRKAIEELLRSP